MSYIIYILGATAALIILVDIILFSVAKHIPKRIFPKNRTFKYYLYEKSFPTFNSPSIYRTNQWGERTFSNKSAPKRILIFGGSSAETFTISGDKHWAKLTEEKLNKDSKRASITSVAKSRTGMRDLPLIVDAHKRIAPKPNIAIVWTGASDLISWGEGGCRADGSGAPGNPRMLVQEPISGNESWKLFRGSLYMLKLFRRNNKSIYRDAGKIFHDDRLDYAKSKKIHICPDPEEFLKSYRKSISETMETFEGWADRVILVTQPILHSDNSDDTSFWHGKRITTAGDTEYLAPELMTHLMRLLHQETQDYAKEHSIECIPMFKLMPSDASLYCDQFHFTEKGMKILADIFYKEIDQIWTRN